MNKVVTIHLNGKAYQLEEGAYDALRAYLARAEAQLAENPDKTEILADLEQAIGEKLQRFLSGHKDVLTLSEVQQVIDEMGPVGGDGGAHASNAKSAGPTPKRLYLVREGAIIAGVCSGLGAYFDVDPNIVRLIFVALTILTGGGWILAYIALALLVPYAETAEEKAAAQGLPFNAQELINRAKAAYARMTDDPNWKGYEYRAHEWKRNWKMAKLERKAKLRAWKLQRKYEYRMQYGTMGPILGLLSGALGLLWILALLSLITTGALFGWVIPAAIPLWLAIVLLFVFYHMVTGPLQAARYGYDGYYAITDAATVAFLIIAGFFVFTHYPQVQEFIRDLPARIRELVNR